MFYETIFIKKNICQDKLKKLKSNIRMIRPPIFSLAFLISRVRLTIKHCLQWRLPFLERETGYTIKLKTCKN